MHIIYPTQATYGDDDAGSSTTGEISNSGFAGATSFSASSQPQSASIARTSSGRATGLEGTLTSRNDETAVDSTYDVVVFGFRNDEAPDVLRFFEEEGCLFDRYEQPSNAANWLLLS